MSESERERDQELSYLRDAVAKLAWTVAKTMPEVPHSYIVRGRTAPEAIYNRLFEAVMRYGVAMQFGPFQNRYLFLGDGFKYWAMTQIRQQSRIINRDDVLDPEGWQPGERKT